MFPGETILTGGKSNNEDARISEFQVMRSGAGWYVGTIFTHGDLCKDPNDYGCMFRDGKCAFTQEPNSRETDYFDSEGEAKNALAVWNATGILTKQRY